MGEKIKQVERGKIGSHILVGEKSGEKNKSLKLKSAEMKAGSIELRDRGSHAQ